MGNIALCEHIAFFVKGGETEYKNPFTFDEYKRVKAI
jgi:hypothetical protein